VPIDCDQYVRYDHKNGKLYWVASDKVKPHKSRPVGEEAGQYYTAITLWISKQSIKAHRVAWFMYYGVDPGNYLIEHIDGNMWNNCIRNLRLTTRKLQAVQVIPRINYKPDIYYSFTAEEQIVLDELYNTYPNCAIQLQRKCHDLHIKAINYRIEAMI